jgi:hypothetical protein
MNRYSHFNALAGSSPAARRAGASEAAVVAITRMAADIPGDAASSPPAPKTRPARALI